MSPEAQQAMAEALDALPLNWKLAALTHSLLMADASGSIANLLEVAAVMAQHLPPEQRTAIAWSLQEAAAELDAKWN